MTTGQKIQTLRKRQGMTQEQLAQVWGFPGRQCPAGSWTRCCRKPPISCP